MYVTKKRSNEQKFNADTASFRKNRKQVYSFGIIQEPFKKANVYMYKYVCTYNHMPVFTVAISITCQNQAFQANYNYQTMLMKKRKDD